MTVFKAYLNIMKKNSIGIMIYFFIFVLISVLSMVSSQKLPSDNVDSNISVAVINNDRDNEFSDKIKKYLDKNYSMKYVKDDNETIKESLISGYVQYVLKINDDSSLEYYVHKDDESVYLINSKIIEYIQINKLLSKYNVKNIEQKSDNIISNDIKLSFHINKDVKKARIINSMYRYYNYQLFVVLAIIMIGTYFIESRFYAGVVKNRISISKMNSRKFNLAVIKSSLSYILFVWLVFSALSVCIFGAGYINSKVGYQFLLSSFIYLIPASGLSFFIASISKNANMNMAITNLLTLTLSFISGVFVPKEFLPEYLEKIALFSPMFWNGRLYSSIVEGVFWNYSTIRYFLVQLLIGITFIMLTLVIHKNRAKNEV